MTAEKGREEMEKYNIIFNDSDAEEEILMVIMARNNQEARRIFNKEISVKIRRCGNDRV